MHYTLFQTEFLLKTFDISRKLTRKHSQELSLGVSLGTSTSNCRLWPTFCCVTFRVAILCAFIRNKRLVARSIIILVRNFLFFKVCATSEGAVSQNVLYELSDARYQVSI